MTRAFLVILLFGLNYQPVFSQRKIIQGTVIDRPGGDPVPYVHIFLIRSSSGTITDANGDFSLMADHSNEDSLRVSCIGYKTLKLSLRSFVNKRTVIELEEDRILLPGFTVHARSAKELVSKCVSKIPVNYAPGENESKAFYWNSVRHDNTYTDFYEGYIRLLKSGKIFYDSTLASVKNPDGQILVFDSLQDILNFDVINKASMFVNPANIDDWKFEYVYSSEYNAESFIIIEASMFDNPFKKSDGFNTLKIFIHEASLAITRIDFTYRWSGGQKYNWENDVQFTVSRLDGTVEYARDHDQKHSLRYLFISSVFSFMKKYKPAIFKTATINHELVILKSYQSLDGKPVARWGDYLDAAKLLDKKGIGQD